MAVNSFREDEKVVSQGKWKVIVRLLSYLKNYKLGDKVSADEKQKVQAEIDSLKALLDSTPMDDMTDAQVEDIKAAKQRLMDTAQGVFTKMYEQAQAGAQGAGPMPNQGAGYQNAGYQQADDVVDADYKEV